MDNKSGKKEKAEYNAFLKRYSGKKVRNRQTGEETEIIIIENHPCLEIWFYYYFRLTAGLYSSYENISPLKPELRRFLPEYEKRIEFFKKCGGLHQYLTAKGGSIENAIKNSEISMRHHSEVGDGAFSEMSGKKFPMRSAMGVWMRQPPTLLWAKRGREKRRGCAFDTASSLGLCFERKFTIESLRHGY